MKRLRLVFFFAEQIGTDGSELPFCCRWMNKITKNYLKSKKVPFKIAGVRSELKWHMLLMVAQREIIQKLLVFVRGRNSTAAKFFRNAKLLCKIIIG
jgi:hypothetical protein